MKIGFSNVDGFTIKGKDLKKTIFSPFGILVFEGNELIFKSLPDMKVSIYRPTSDKSETKVVFLSKNFDRIQTLSDDEDYLVLFFKENMIIHQKNIYGEVVAIIPGESL